MNEFLKVSFLTPAHNPASTIHAETIKFLSALELAPKAADLARQVISALKRMSLKQSKVLQPLVEGLEDLKGLLVKHDHAIDQRRAGIAELVQA